MTEPREPWWRSTPFPRHWRAYVWLKLLVLVVAAAIALKLLGVY